MWSLGCERSLGQNRVCENRAKWMFLRYSMSTKGKVWLRNKIFLSPFFNPWKKILSEKNDNGCKKSWSVRFQCLKPTPHWNFGLALKSLPSTPFIGKNSHPAQDGLFGVLEVAAQSTSCQMKFVQDVIDLSASLFDLFVARVVNVTPPSSWASRSRRVDRCDVFTPFKLLLIVQSQDRSIFVSLILVWCRKTFTRRARIKDKKMRNEVE